MIRRIVSVVLVLGACAAAVVLTGASDEKGGKRYKVVFDNAFGLTEGGDLRVGGVKAGKTVKFNLFQSKDNSDPIKAEVEVAVTEPGFDSFREDATCDIRQQSLIGEYYVDCQPGTGKELADGGVIPVKQTTSTIPVDLVNNVLRRPYRERLRLIIAELGTGLAGRPEDLAETIRRAHPGLRETVKTLKILGEQQQIIKDFISNSDTVVAALERKKKDVARFVTEAGETAEISASRAGDLRAQFQKLPVFLRELEPYMVRLGELSDEQVPLLTDLRRAAPDLNRFLAELGPFAEASRPAFRSLGRLSDTGQAAVRESADEIRQLRALAGKAPRFGKPLRQLLQSLDDRRRSIQPEPLTRELAPPAPDKTAFATQSQGGGSGGGLDRSQHGPGFTGFEAVWNYFFQQTLAINAFDEVSHLLRVFAVEGHTSEECAPYSVDPDPHLQEDCSSYTGPFQPGLNHPQPGDPTGVDCDPTEPRSKCGRPGATAAGADRKEPEEPEAEKPRKGERDLSKPQPGLPGGLEELLKPRKPADRLRDLLDAAPVEPPEVPTPPSAPRAPDAPRSNGPSPDTQLLDFLLGP